jgi:hypothetical protein
MISQRRSATTVQGQAEFLWIICAVLTVASVFVPRAGHAQSVLVQEGFEDTAFASRGWYDGGSTVLSTAERYSGAASYECRFMTGARTCPAPARHLFAATESVYISFRIKHSPNWVGSGKPYHPHMFNFLTNVDGNYIGPAYTHLTTYVEENGGRPALALQDAMNIDEARVGQDLTNITESRAVAGCNGDSDGLGNGDCYPVGSVHRNGKEWRTAAVYFGNTPGTPTYKGDWHLVEAYFKLNSIVGGKGAKDGIIQYWFDGNLVIDHSNAVLRTGAHPTMKFNQLFFGPYIGDGSPVDQAFWIDDLIIAAARPGVPPAPPSSSGALPSAPTNLRIVP